ncbi:MAG: aspartate aminotransferase family protein [Solirubrobacterales bacterium]|nr:aspartate aminotransferase family protein [Solirubrobacterales bacterium]
MSAFWHPFSDMSKAEENRVVMQRGDGCWLWDEDGTRYLDATAALWFCNVGYGRRELAERAAAQMSQLAAYSTFDVYASRPALELAERISEIAPTEGPNGVFFTNGGSDAVDTAGKMVRRYWQLEGEPERTVIISRAGAYHGMNAYGTSLAGIPANFDGWGTLVSDVVHVGANDLDSLRQALEANEGRVAAFIGEPVVGAGGVRPPADGYWEGVQKLLREHGVLLVADEVVSGFGRFGTWFASESLGIVPDLVTCAKGVTSGYLPLGAVIAGDRVRSTIWEGGAFRHGYTYSGHPAACAVALANLEIIELEQLRRRASSLAPELRTRFSALEDEPLIEEVRTAGLLAGVELSSAALAEDPGLLDRTVVKARERGVLIRALAGTTIQISPPFVASESEFDLIVATIREAVAAAAEDSN